MRGACAPHSPDRQRLFAVVECTTVDQCGLDYPAHSGEPGTRSAPIQLFFALMVLPRLMRIYLDSIGCRLNQSEMESLARQLAGRGHTLASSPAKADRCILNTCSVTREAERKSRQAARRIRRANPDTQLLITGCYATLCPDQAAAVEGVTQVVANPQKQNILAILDPDQQSTERGACWRLPGGRTRAFVKVQDGCDNRCSYCITTIARGEGRTRPLADVVGEIQALESAGYQEVVLTGVHVGSYGRDRASRDGSGQSRAPNLRRLIQTILSETGIPRLRLSSLEPWNLDSDLLDLWQNPRLCRQLHLPLQSGSASVLRRMGRRTTPEAYRWLAEAALDTIPDLALTTDIIVGFPGESDSEIEASLEFVRQLDFARLHVFGYSRRPGTRAAQMEGQLPRALVRKRSRLMRALGRQKQEAFLRRFLGRTMEVLWESTVSDNGSRGLWRGHTGNYIQVTADAAGERLWNSITPTLLTGLRPGGMWGILKREP